MAEQSSNLPDRLIYSWQRPGALTSECSIDFSHWSKRRPMSVTASGSSLGLAHGTDYWMWVVSWKAHDSSGNVAHRWFIRNTLLKFLLINLQRRKRSESESVHGLSNDSECCVCFKSRKFFEVATHSLFLSIYYEGAEKFSARPISQTQISEQTDLFFLTDGWVYFYQ